MNSRSGRSVPLAAARLPSVRRRNYLLRWLLLSVLTVAVVLTVAGGVLRQSAMEGPGRFLYQLHDSVWLFLKGWLWTALFPYGLVILTVLAALAFTVLLEFLLGVSPLRSMHRHILVRAFLNRAGRALLVGAHRLRLPLGYARTVLATEIERSQRLLLQQLESGSDAGATRLCRLALLRFRLSSASGLDWLQAFEVLSLAQLTGARPERAQQQLTDMLDRAAPELGPEFEAAVAEQSVAGRLNVTSEDPVQLALQVIRQGRTGGRDALTFHDDWARQRLSGPHLAEAEGLVSFEFWSAWSEPAVRPQPFSGLLADALEPGSRVRERGHRFARQGDSQ